MTFFVTDAATITFPERSHITVHSCNLRQRTEVHGNVSQMALCAVVNINLYLAERGVAMAIVTVLSPGKIKTASRLFFLATDGIERL